MVVADAAERQLEQPSADGAHRCPPRRRTLVLRAARAGPGRPIRRESVVGSGVHRARTAREEGSRGHPGTAAAGQGEGVRRRTK